MATPLKMSLQNIRLHSEVFHDYSFSFMVWKVDEVFSIKRFNVVDRKWTAARCTKKGNSTCKACKTSFSRC